MAQYKYDATSGISTIDGVNTGAGANAGRTENLHLFKTNLYGQSLTGMRISNCKIYNNETQVRNYVPVRYNETGELGMFDLVNAVFYKNAGTGEFIAGPEIV